MWLRNWVTLCSGRWAQPQEIHHDWTLLIMETLFSFAGDWFRGDHRSNFDQSDTRETAAGWVGRLLGKVFLPDKKWGAWEKSIFLLAFEFGLLWRYLKPQQSSCLTNGQDSQLLAAQRTQDMLPIPGITVASRNLNREHFSELLNSAALWS